MMSVLCLSVFGELLAPTYDNLQCLSAHSCISTSYISGMEVYPFPGSLKLFIKT